MSSERDPLSFPECTLFCRLDGVLFAVISDERWMGIGDDGRLINLSKPYSDELARMIDLWELIDESQFRSELCPGCVLPA